MDFEPWDNPMGTDGFEFIEYAAPDPKALGALFEQMGFAAIARHRHKNVTLYRQGEINFIINAEQDSFAQRFARQHGPSVCAIAIRVADAGFAYQRALELGKTLHDIDTSFGQDTPDRIRQRLDVLATQGNGPERERQITFLERQLKTSTELADRRATIAARLESSVLAMQNMRFDLIRLRSAGVGAVLSDLTQATQQARAISRDVDHAIAAASEVREAMG